MKTAWTQAQVDAHNAKVFGMKGGLTKREYIEAILRNEGVLIGEKTNDFASPPGEQTAWQPHAKIGCVLMENNAQLNLTIKGQIRGGKNNMVVTRSGHHFPRKSWALWRDEAVNQVKAQLPINFETLTERVNVRLTYLAGDLRRRDQPAILDAIFHVLEAANVVQDDTLLWVNESTRGYDKENPRVEITITKQ